MHYEERFGVSVISLSEGGQTLMRARGNRITEVPPSIWPMLNVVRGMPETLVLMNAHGAHGRVR